MSNAKRFVPLVAFILLCWLAPVLLYLLLGPLIGLAGGLISGGVWYWRFRFPFGNQERSDYWFIAAGYIVIGLILIRCISKMIGM